MIPYNKPYLTGKELDYIKEAVESGKISGNGIFTEKCQEYFQDRFGFKKTLLTTSCTDALEMISLLLDIKEGDEVIMPSYTFVSTANAFILRGAKIVFVDSHNHHPNIDSSKIRDLITEKTKAIVIVHYAGMACDMQEIVSISKEFDVPLVEDAAQAITTKYKDQYLGTFGDFSAFSFHETKNIIAGEGGLLAINNEEYLKRAEIIWEKGTNRAAFFRGEVAKYNWVDLGSSFLPSELNSAFLFAQLENIDDIIQKRKSIWNSYYSSFKAIEVSGKVKLPLIPDNSTNNAHIFYLVCKDINQRNGFIKFMKEHDILTVFHYLPLHKSEFYLESNQDIELPNAQFYGETLVRLPLFYELQDKEVDHIIDKVIEYFNR